ncbi:hypothetical protein QEH42_gp232 [Microbacterium phage Pumpernickel]|uniref:Uncharacterized protein n=1 Tax=Microbacterium phage Pumpernickel TaxID=2885983 RepID=A0AAE9C3I3_9CAUD|nr:hypothetical protein QEH42_gp232 [Microbacterium phage Pumpernickel]UDL15986.1 hypothetical protein SEA_PUMPERNICKEL_236 [Microbacterium phage Pumpernickel]
MTDKTGLYEVPEGFFYEIFPKQDEDDFATMRLVRVREEQLEDAMQAPLSLGTNDVVTYSEREVIGFVRKTFLGIPYGNPINPIYSDEPITAYIRSVVAVWPRIDDLSDENLYTVSETLWNRYKADEDWLEAKLGRKSRVRSISGEYPPKKLSD